MHSLFGWRGAFLGAAVLGRRRRRGAAVPAATSEPRSRRRQAARRRARRRHDWRLLLTAPILINFVFFLLLCVASFGLQNFSVVALGALYGTSPVTANTALSGYLMLSALGVLVGGWIAGRIERHRLVAALGMLATALACDPDRQRRSRRGAARSW